MAVESDNACVTTTNDTRRRKRMKSPLDRDEQVNVAQHSKIITIGVLSPGVCLYEGWLM